MSCTTDILQQRSTHPRPQRVGWRGAARRLWSTLKTWHERAQQRRQLLGLSDSALKDIALSRADALRETGKPFWRE